MVKEKIIRKYVAITPRIEEMVDEIKKEKGYKSFTSVLENAIIQFHGSIFKDYVMARKVQAGKTPEEKADTQIRIQEIKKQREEDALMAFATQLEAKVTGPQGDRRVQYYMYDKYNRYLQEVPLEAMSQEIVDAQYFPSKEDVLRRQKEGKVNYDPKVKEYN